MSEKLIPNPNYDDKENHFLDNLNYVLGLEIPKKLQIKNLIQNTLKAKIIKTSNFNFSG